MTPEVELQHLRSQIAGYETEIARLWTDNDDLRRRGRRPTLREQEEIEAAADAMRAETCEDDVDRRVDET